ncbi:MAG: hypothetical protein F4X66_03650 [Chloroflexi bacterium]|nr:hypothetical protein [Chloroflexota bacterium]MYE39513.1 hypothetical protein [Chloroflexota bacterium]
MQIWNWMNRIAEEENESRRRKKEEEKQARRQKVIESTREKRGLAEALRFHRITGAELDQVTRRQAIDDGWELARPKRWRKGKFSSERKRLYDILDSDESIEHVVGGLLKANLTGKGRMVPHDAVAIATNKRVIFFDEGLTGSAEVLHLPYRNIEAVSHKTGLTVSELQVTGRGGSGFKLEGIDDRDSLRNFSDGVRSRSERGAVASAAPVPSSLDDLERLASLLERGYLTQEEFDAKKAQLLGL